MTNRPTPMTNRPASTAEAANPVRPGRRAGKPDTRAQILAAARAAFAESGYAATSIRRIAARARVDPSLVYHYFGGKEKVLLAALEVPLDPRDIAARLADGPIETLGLRLAGTVLRAWESPAGPALKAALRLALTESGFSGLLRDFLVAGVVRPLLLGTGCPPAEVEARSGLVMSQMAGLVTARYLLALGPVARMPLADLVANVGPTLQRYLTGPLQSAHSAAPRPGDRELPQERVMNPLAADPVTAAGK